MTLDLTKVVSQVISMVSVLRNNRDQRKQRLGFALETLGKQGSGLEHLKRKINASKTTWLVANPMEEPDKRHQAPAAPADFAALATDGSHIDVDRHRAARCYLINIGSAVISYGRRPEAILSSSPHLYCDEKELVIPSSGTSWREQLIEGALLGIKRTADECCHLAELATRLPADIDSLALLDGTLILWGLEGYPESVTETFLTSGLLRSLDVMKKLNGERRLAVASYVSFPRSTDVVNMLRVAICPHEPTNCDRFCPPDKERDCEAVAGVLDQELFMNLLKNGERSALFISPSTVVREHYGEHSVYFFYLRTEDEIARIEVPQWVAENNDLLNLTHGLVLDQCRRGHGYPVVLSEAHEQAVVTSTDRENFWGLVESLMVDEHLPTPSSAKSFSKRTRWV